MSRRCARPGCGRPAAATLSFSCPDRSAWLDDLHPTPHPANHDLCRDHADRTGAPRGWHLRDRRAGGRDLGLRLTG